MVKTQQMDKALLILDGIALVAAIVIVATGHWDWIAQPLQHTAPMGKLI